MGGRLSQTFPALVQSFPASGQQMVYCHGLSQDTTGMISLPPPPFRYI